MPLIYKQTTQNIYIYIKERKKNELALVSSLVRHKTEQRFGKLKRNKTKRTIQAWSVTQVTGTREMKKKTGRQYKSKVITKCRERGVKIKNLEHRSSPCRHEQSPWNHKIPVLQLASLCSFLPSHFTPLPSISMRNFLFSLYSFQREKNKRAI